MSFRIQRDGEIRRPFAPEGRALAIGGGYDPARLDYEEGLDRADRRRLRLYVLAAAAIHLALLAVNLPGLAERPLEAAVSPKVFVIQQVRFRPPPVRVQQEIPERRVKRVPIPDPTPDEPEPIRLDEVLLPVEIDLPAPDTVFLGVPDGPPAPPRPALPAGVFEVGGEVTPPVKIHAPEPVYTEEARAARVQGVVILRAIIDAGGEVVDVQVLKGLPMGLAEKTVETVSGWRFEPARRGGEPVAVYFNFTVSFSLQ